MKQTFYFSHLPAPPLALALALLCHAVVAEDSISLTDAVSRAIAQHPSLAVFDADTRLAEAKTISALMPPNPELETEAEDVLGTGELDGFQSAVYTVGISQLIETAGKRKLRGEVARAGETEQELQYETAKREVIAETGRRYIAVLAAQNEEANAEADYSIANEAFLAIQQQIEEGRGSAIQSGQALLGRNEAKFGREAASRRAALARQQLSAMWGKAKPDFSSVTGKLSAPAGSLPDVDTLVARSADHPAVAMAKAGVTAADIQLTLEERKKVPDLTVGVGFRNEAAIDDNAVVFRMSLPLPLFQRNEGGIAEAEAGIAKSEALVAEARMTIEMQIAEAHTRLLMARSQYELVAGEMLPAAAENYEAVSEGFKLGRISYLELLEARRTLNTVRRQRIETLSQYHSARIDLEAISGASL